MVHILHTYNTILLIDHIKPSADRVTIIAVLLGGHISSFLRQVLYCWFCMIWLPFYNYNNYLFPPTLFPTALQEGMSILVYVCDVWGRKANVFPHSLCGWWRLNVEQNRIWWNSASSESTACCFSITKSILKVEHYKISKLYIDYLGLSV